MMKRDFELIAGVLNEAYISTVNERQEAVRDLITLFADELEDTNPRFDRERFIAAATKQ